MQKNVKHTSQELSKAMSVTINETSKHAQKYAVEQRSITASCQRLQKLLREDWNDPQVFERLIKEMINLQSLTLQLLARSL